MAIVYIIPIRSRLDRTLSYVGNKLKTKNKNYEEALLDLHNALNYPLFFPKILSPRINATLSSPINSAPIINASASPLGVS